MKLEGLTKGERFVVDWQYRMHGHFYESLARTVQLADGGNLNRLEKGFPEEVQAMRKFMSEEGWWENLQIRIGVRLKRNEEDVDGG